MIFFSSNLNGYGAIPIDVKLMENFLELLHLRPLMILVGDDIGDCDITADIGDGKTFNANSNIWSLNRKPLTFLIG